MMTIELSVVIYILILHWIGDFLLQTSWMARNKSKSFKALSAHTAIYTFPLMLINPVWAVVNGLLHGIVDAITSRMTSYFHIKGNTRSFFIVIGLDQTIHFITLFSTYTLLY